MSYTAIKTENIGKKYRIGQYEARYKTMRDAIADSVKSGFLNNLRNLRRPKKYFWALEDISFEVKPGETVGIIGHNGAGKSTLLKILSRITEPTKGTADIYGRVGSLLEVGTGFHLELTGRENTYLSGAILGMKKSDIDARFDEIVAFAGVEKFVDTPIKHYSSGMHLRLAFAVAAHLEPDILLVDEVLAVGDLEFQKKCLNKMEDVATEGRTVLFVSHNMGSIKELCRSALVLKNGRVDFHGDVVQAIRHYSKNVLNTSAEGESAFNKKGWFGLHLKNSERENQILNTEDFEISVNLSLQNDIKRAAVHCYLDDADGNQIFHNHELKFENLKKGIHKIGAQIPPLYLKPGVYTLYLKLIGEDQTADRASKIRYFSERLVIDITDQTNMFSGKIKAMILPPIEWKISKAEQINSAFASWVTL